MERAGEAGAGAAGAGAGWRQGNIEAEADRLRVSNEILEVRVKELSQSLREADDRAATADGLGREVAALRADIAALERKAAAAGDLNARLVEELTASMETIGQLNDRASVAGSPSVSRSSSRFAGRAEALDLEMELARGDAASSVGSSRGDFSDVGAVAPSVSGADLVGALAHAEREAAGDRLTRVTVNVEKLVVKRVIDPDGEVGTQRVAKIMTTCSADSESMAVDVVGAPGEVMRLAFYHSGMNRVCSANTTIGADGKAVLTASSTRGGTFSCA